MRRRAAVLFAAAGSVGAAPGGPVSRDVGVLGMEVGPPEAAAAVLDAMERGANAARACHADPLVGAGADGETVVLSFHVRGGRALGARVDPWVRQDVGTCVQKALRDWAFTGVPDADVSWTFAVMPSAGPAPEAERARTLRLEPKAMALDVQRALDRQSTDVSACRATHPSGAPVVMGFAVYGGRVEMATTIESRDPTLASCVLERLMGWPFPPDVDANVAWTVP